MLMTILLFSIILRSIWNFLLLQSNIKWLFDQEINEEIDKYPFINICIPALREQSVILDTIEYFSKFNYPKNRYKLFIITTKKEDFEKLESKTAKILNLKTSLNLKTIEEFKSKNLGILPQCALEKLYNLNNNVDIENFYNTYPTTKQLAESVMNEYNHFEIIEYPKNNTTATEQINYGLEYIYQKAEKNSWVAIYNADSRPNLNTLTKVIEKSISFEKKNSRKANIIQQSSLFTLNCNNLPASLEGFIAFAGGIYQTKFTLVHELFLFRTQSWSGTYSNKTFFQKLWNSQTSYCVGHGMFIRFDYFKNRGFYPSETLNEDLPFGFYTSVLGEPIIPLKILENSETPTTVRDLINQKTVWFNPYMEYLKCREKYIKENPNKDSLILNIITLKALFIGFIWFVQSFILLFPLILSIATKDLILFSGWYLAFSLYWFLPTLYILQYIKKLELNAGQIVTRLTFTKCFGVLFFGQLNALFDSVGPILCVIKFAKSKMFGNPIIKLKTER